MAAITLKHDRDVLDKEFCIISGGKHHNQEDRSLHPGRKDSEDKASATTNLERELKNRFFCKLIDILSLRVFLFYIKCLNDAIFVINF